MAQNIQIQYVDTTGNTPDTIESFGGVFREIPWKLSHAAIIDAVEKGIYSFYIVIFENVISCVVGLYNGKKILKTKRDSGNLYHLMMLPPSSTYVAPKPAAKAAAKPKATTKKTTTKKKK